MNLLFNLLSNNAEPNKKREKLATTSEEAITVSLFLSYRISALTHDNKIHKIRFFRYNGIIIVQPS